MRIRVGLVGTGVIAQVMHLHYLAELADRYEVAAVCDLEASSARACAERFGIPAVFTDWRDLLGHPLDAVMVLTSGIHAPIAEAAARAGRHVFVEKPMCFSADEGRAMVAAAEHAGVKLMTGYPKRYDPAFARMRTETAQLTDARLLRVTTFESPLRPYIQHYPLLPRATLPAEVTAGLRADSDERIRTAVGAASDLERQVYEMVLLDTLVHELNTVRGLLGEPTRLEYASLALDCVTVMLRFGALPVAIHWIDLPGIARYGMEFALYALTVGQDPNVPSGTQVLDQVAAAGYAGIDLGPVGYLGDGERLGELLAERGLGLAGAYVELPYSDPAALEGAVGELDAILGVFDAVRSYLPGPAPRPTLADKGSKERAMLPARSVRDHSLGFDADGWRRFAAGLSHVIARCRDRGYEPTFHPETGTHIEAPWEIERVLEVSDVGLCLETGHMLLGGGDPVAMLRDLGG
ncbi:MAG TPA: Gfo/Idh/MocA family oxidoreductase, partial [Streptosporangiaceae bacterium]